METLEKEQIELSTNILSREVNIILTKAARDILTDVSSKGGGTGCSARICSAECEYFGADTTDRDRYAALDVPALSRTYIHKVAVIRRAGSGACHVSPCCHRNGNRSLRTFSNRRTVNQLARLTISECNRSRRLPLYYVPPIPSSLCTHAYARVIHKALYVVYLLYTLVSPLFDRMLVTIDWHI